MTHQIFSTAFAKVYPMYVQKAGRKGRTKEEVDRVICWPTGYSQAGLMERIERQVDLRAFFDQALRVHPNTALIQQVYGSSVC